MSLALTFVSINSLPPSGRAENTFTLPDIVVKTEKGKHFTGNGHIRIIIDQKKIEFE